MEKDWLFPNSGFNLALLFHFIFSSGLISLDSKSCFQKLWFSPFSLLCLDIVDFFIIFLITVAKINYGNVEYADVNFLIQEYENNLFLQCDKCRMMVSPYLIPFILSFVFK